MIVCPFAVASDYGLRPTKKPGEPYKKRYIPPRSAAPAVAGYAGNALRGGISYGRGWRDRRFVAPPRAGDEGVSRQIAGRSEEHGPFDRSLVVTRLFSRPALASSSFSVESVPLHLTVNRQPCADGERLSVCGFGFIGHLEVR